MGANQFFMTIFRNAFRKTEARFRGFLGTLPPASRSFFKSSFVINSYLNNIGVSVKRRVGDANGKLGTWALREAPPAFRFRGNKYATSPGSPGSLLSPQASFNQQKKANMLSAALALSAAATIIITPLYLNHLHGSRITKYKQDTTLGSAE